MRRAAVAARRPALAALVVLPLLLAGCTVEPPALEGEPFRPRGGPGQGQGAGDDPAATGTGNPLDPFDLANRTIEEVRLAAPQWAVGDAWRFGITTPDGGGTQQLVVVGMDLRDYQVATTDPDDAADTAFYKRSLPGPVGRQTLAGYSDGNSGNYFPFPLEQNKTWSLHLGNTPFQVRANYTPTVEGTNAPGFKVEGASVSGSMVRTAYVPGVKWLPYFEVAAPDGQVMFRRTLSEHRVGYTGPYYTAQVQDLYTKQQSGGVYVPIETFDVQASRNFDRLRIVVDAVQTDDVTVGADVRLLDPNGVFRYEWGTMDSEFNQADMPPVPGEWKVWIGTTEGMTVHVRIAGIVIERGEL